MACKLETTAESTTGVIHGVDTPNPKLCARRIVYIKTVNFLLNTVCECTGVVREGQAIQSSCTSMQISALLNGSISANTCLLKKHIDTQRLHKPPCVHVRSYSAARATDIVPAGMVLLMSSASMRFNWHTVQARHAKSTLQRKQLNRVVLCDPPPPPSLFKSFVSHITTLRTAPSGISNI